MEINLNDIAKLLKAQKAQLKVIEQAFKVEVNKNKEEPKEVSDQVDVGDAFAEEFHAKALAEKNTEEITKVVESEVMSPKDVPNSDELGTPTGLD